ncbi:MAG: hypothetical protein INQ03_13980 [Candidatus Heimdallarchaeota archaeon]|nr:hypothetical protein [Candidatus Heimdallarchaeota archaeon]
MEWYFYIIFGIIFLYIFSMLNKRLDYRYYKKQVEKTASVEEMKSRVEELGFVVHGFDEKHNFEELVLTKDNITIRVEKVWKKGYSLGRNKSNLMFDLLTSNSKYLVEIELAGVNLPEFYFERYQLDLPREYFSIDSSLPEEASKFFHASPDEFYEILSRYIILLSVDGDLLFGCDIDVSLISIKELAEDAIALKKTVELLRSAAVKLDDNIETASYICSFCESELEYNVGICPKCNNPAPTCIICYKNPDPLEDISLLVCCSNYVHSLHIKTWFETELCCPYCKTEQPFVINVVEKIYRELE